MIIGLDFETFWSKKLHYSMRTMIGEQYCRHDLFDPYLVTVCDGTSVWAGSPRDFNWDALAGHTVVAHNARFERDVTAELERRGWIKPILSRIADFHCTANLTSYICNRRSLADSVEFLYSKRLEKDTRDDSKGKHWLKDFTPEQRTQMIEYAKLDPFWSRQIFVDFVDKWPVIERKLSSLIIEQGRRGVQIDTDLLNRYIMITHDMKMATEKALPWMGTDEEDDEDDFSNVIKKPTATSTKCIAEKCRRVGIPCPPVKKDDGGEAFDEWEAFYGREHPWIKSISAWRSINKMCKTFEIMKQRIRSDGTLPFGIKYFGAVTGRTSGESKINMLNMRRTPILRNEHGMMETEASREDAANQQHEETGRWPEWVKDTVDFRNLIIPRPGKKMIVSDLSQIEPRVLAWLSGNMALLDQLRQGQSIYEAHARGTMGWTGGSLKKENPEQYKLAKARILALGYGAGWEKFILMAKTLTRMDITANDPEFVETLDENGDPQQVSGYGLHAKRWVAEFREQNRPITDLWRRLDEGLRNSVGQDFYIGLPSGRKMNYRAVRQEVRIETDEEGKSRKRWVLTAETDGRRHLFYGGKLCENITQAAARDVFIGHEIELGEQAGINVLFSVYDEAVLECDQSVTARDVEHIMSKCPEWMSGLPVGAEAKEVPHYLK
jgi:hypothetical protein